MRATADAWVQVRDATGTILFSKVLHAGKAGRCRSEPDLTLTTGNAGGTEIVLDGAATTPLGGSGAVRRDLPLDLIDAILSWRLTPAPHRGTPQRDAPIPPGPILTATRSRAASTE